MTTMIYLSLTWLLWFICCWHDYYDLFVFDMITMILIIVDMTTVIYLLLTWLLWFICRWHDYFDLFVVGMTTMIYLSLTWLLWFICRWHDYYDFNYCWHDYYDLFDVDMTTMIYLLLTWLLWFICCWHDFYNLLFVDILTTAYRNVLTLTVLLLYCYYWVHYTLSIGYFVQCMLSFRKCCTVHVVYRYNCCILHAVCW